MSKPSRRKSTATRTASARRVGGHAAIIRQLEAIERDGGDGTVEFGGRRTLHVSSLDKPFFPQNGLTKGDVMRYYAAVADALLPVVKDRPLILKRYPDGIGGSSFFQQNPGRSLPNGVRTGTVITEIGASALRIIGGDLLTLLYTVQIGTIAVHAWQARMQSCEYADTTTIDLDPGDDVSFSDVVTLARSIKHELDAMKLIAGVKTSGSSGIHIVLPMPLRTTFERAARVAELVAERTARTYPKRATVERSIQRRPAGSIYVDAQQNAQGK